jgi:glutamyl-tRNA synthetase
MTTTVRTRIAPSPTGFLHLGTARTALYSWAYARHHGGQFVFRIEDTDVERSTQDSVQQIIESMNWLGLDYDEGPVYQMQRLDRYREVVDQMIAAGTAYRCYATPAELDAMREAQKARGEKTLYDRRWRPEPGKTLPTAPEGVQPVIRFANPVDGDVTWHDLVKGDITINNREIDDLIIMRGDSVPTYNFAVVVDDWDMRISHVFRGDEHVNNTPWQINMYRALGAPLPHFGHFPVILGDDGQKLSKRRGAVSVTAYRDKGYLPQAMLNYLARLGWSHGDDEVFNAKQLVEWFDGTHLTKSAAQWDAAKLDWVNQQHMKALSDADLAAAIRQRALVGIEQFEEARLQAACALFRDRCAHFSALEEWLATLVAEPARDADDAAKHLTDAAKPLVAALADQLKVCEWSQAGVSAAFKAVIAATGAKMPAIAMPARVLLVGKAQTPAVDALIALMDREAALERLASFA